MSVLYVVVPLALVLVGAAVLAFLWAAGRGQFDDVATPALRALLDDDPPAPPAPAKPSAPTAPPAAPRG